MKSILLTILGLVVGLALIVSGFYYLMKEKDDRDSVKVYRTFVIIGVVVTIATVIKIIVAGF